MPQPRNAPDPQADRMEVILIRHKSGCRPQLHFKPRGGETLWNAALMKLIGRNNLPPEIPFPALTAIEPHLNEIAGALGVLLDYRRNALPPDKLTFWIDGNGPEDDRKLNGYAARLRSVPTPALKNIHDRLLNLVRKQHALTLLALHFPARLAEIRPADTWTTVFSRFIRYVEDADWFPIDRDNLETAYRVWQDEPEEAGADWLAEYLEIIPLPVFVPDEENALEDGVLRVFMGLFENHYVLEQDDLRPWGLSAAEINEDAIYRGVMKAAEGGRLLPADYGVPLRFLPTVAQMYRRETGLPILDEPANNEELYTLRWETGRQPGFLWAHDVHELRQEWQLARPLVDRWDAFHTWCVAEANFRRAVELAICLGGAP